MALAIPTASGKSTKAERAALYKSRSDARKGRNTINLATEGGARGTGLEDEETQSALREVDRQSLETPGGSITAGRTLSFSMGGGPTVMTNANKTERVIPLLDSRVNSLSTFNLTGESGGGASFGDVGEDTTSVEDQESAFEEALGLTSGKKKKQDELLLSSAEKQQLALLEQMQKTQDKRLRQSMSQTRQAFNAREAELRDVNQEAIRNIKNVLNLAGSARYAPISSQNIISAQEASLINNLSELDALEQKTIAEIQQARDDLDYQTLEKKFDFLDDLRKEKQIAADELDATVKEQETQIQKDNAIANLIQQGITDPIEIFNSVNADGGIPMSMFEITQSLKGLEEFTAAGKGIGFEIDKKSIGKLLGSGFTSVDIQNMQKDLNSGVSIDDVLSGFDEESQNIVKEALGIDETQIKDIVPGKGAKTSVEETLIRTRLFAKIAPILNKGAISDTDRAIIDGRIAEFRDAGMSEQEILDTLAGIPLELNTPYNNQFRDIIVSNSETIEKQNSSMGRLSQQLSAGNYMGAMNTVENLSLTEAKKLDPDNYMGTGSTQFSLKTSDDLRKLLEDAEDVLGPIEGSLERVKGKLLKSRDPRATKIAAEITKLTAPMRNQLSGTAVTESETAFLEPLIPSISDTIENINAKVDALESQALDRYNTTRSMVSLPEVTKEQVIDPKKRLILYSNDIYLPANNQLDI